MKEGPWTPEQAVLVAAEAGFAPGDAWVQDDESLAHTLNVAHEMLMFGHHPNRDNTVTVGRFKFLPITNKTPKGSKLILQGPGDCMTIGTYDGDPQWKGWFPAPDCL